MNFTRGKLFIFVLLAVGGLASVRSQETVENDQLQKLKARLNPEVQPWSLEYVVERVAEHLATIHESKRPRIRYFDMSELPQARLPEATAALFFWVNSTSSDVLVSRPQPVPNSGNRLFWVDLRNLRWTATAWEAVAAEDPFFREPLIPSDSPALAYIRSVTGSSSIVLKSAWWCYYASDTSLFLKGNETKADNAFYYTLLYSENIGKVKRKVRKEISAKDKDGKTIRKTVEEEVEEEVRGAVPQNVKEFERFWGINDKLLIRFPTDQGAVVDEADSIVSLHNRILRRRRTELGAYWQSYDVFRSVGEQDFIETLPRPPKIKHDASEHILQDGKGAQIYFLAAGDGARLEFGDPRVVRDTISGGPPIVRVGASCAACHVNGIIPMKNEAKTIKDSGLKLVPLDEDFERSRRQFYDGDLDRLVTIDQGEYAVFIKAANGLLPQENASQFGQARAAYAAPLSLQQAARECGASVQEFSDAISLGTKGRLGRLLTDGRPVPRSSWDFGLFQEAYMLLLHHRSLKNPTTSLGYYMSQMPCVPGSPGMCLPLPR